MKPITLEPAILKPIAHSRPCCGRTSTLLNWLGNLFRVGLAVGLVGIFAIVGYVGSIYLSGEASHETAPTLTSLMTTPEIVVIYVFLVSAAGLCLTFGLTRAVHG